MNHNGATIVRSDGPGVRIDQLAVWIEPWVFARSAVGIVETEAVFIDRRFPRPIVVLLHIDHSGMSSNWRLVEPQLQTARRGSKDAEGRGDRSIDSAEQL